MTSRGCGAELAWRAPASSAGRRRGGFCSWDERDLTLLALSTALFLGKSLYLLILLHSSPLEPHHLDRTSKTNFLPSSASCAPAFQPPAVDLLLFPVPLALGELAASCGGREAWEAGGTWPGHLGEVRGSVGSVCSPICNPSLPLAFSWDQLLQPLTVPQPAPPPPGP